MNILLSIQRCINKSVYPNFLINKMALFFKYFYIHPQSLMYFSPLLFKLLGFHTFSYFTRMRGFLPWVSLRENPCKS